MAQVQAAVYVQALVVDRVPPMPGILLGRGLIADEGGVDTVSPAGRVDITCDITAHGDLFGDGSRQPRLTTVDASLGAGYQCSKGLRKLAASARVRPGSRA